jgi:hypothetical protein
LTKKKEDAPFVSRINESFVNEGLNESSKLDRIEDLEDSKNEFFSKSKSKKDRLSQNPNKNIYSCRKVYDRKDNRQQTCTKF